MGDRKEQCPEESVPMTPPESCVDPEDYYEMPPSSVGSRSIPYDLMCLSMKSATHEKPTRTPSADTVRNYIKKVADVEVPVESIQEMTETGSDESRRFRTIAMVRGPSVQAAATVFIKH